MSSSIKERSTFCITTTWAKSPPTPHRSLDRKLLQIASPPPAMPWSMPRPRSPKRPPRTIERLRRSPQPEAWKSRRAEQPAKDVYAFRDRLPSVNYPVISSLRAITTVLQETERCAHVREHGGIRSRSPSLAKKPTCRRFRGAVADRRNCALVLPGRLEPRFGRLAIHALKIVGKSVFLPPPSAKR